MKPIKTTTRLPHPVNVLCALCLFTVVPVVAQSGGDYELSWSTIAPSATGGAAEYELSGSLIAAGAGALSGGDYALTGGFWFGIAPGDCDFDGDVDLSDSVPLGACLSGPDVPVPPDCGCVDLNRDGHVDLADFAAFQQLFSS